MTANEMDSVPNSSPNYVPHLPVLSRRPFSFRSSVARLDEPFSSLSVWRILRRRRRPRHGPGHHTLAPTSGDLADTPMTTRPSASVSFTRDEVE
jgi:hypothetical protein